jgi:CheY-like chemotaxis protein
VGAADRKTGDRPVERSTLPQPFQADPAPHVLTILVVDDNPAVLQITTKLLTKWGYHVLSADGPIEALTLAASCSTPIDLVVSDINMPVMDGIQLWGRMQRICPAAKVVFMSGQKKPARLNGEPFLAKPFVPKELRAIVETIVRGSAD